MMEKLVKLWYAIPREKEWWFDQIGKILSGCATGCFTFLFFWIASTTLTVAVCIFFFARNVNEGFTMGLAWGCPLGLTMAMVAGSFTLSLISRYREG